MSSFFLINLRDVPGDEELEKMTDELIESYSCPQNAEVEQFLKYKALDFTKRKCSISYLVLDEDKHLQGYFTLAHKNLCVNSKSMSASKKRKFHNYAGDDEDGFFNVSAFLIAQLGRNFRSVKTMKIEGTQLLQLAMDKLRDAQNIVGGGVVFLECENHRKLLDFYQGEPHFFQWIGERESKSDNVCYQQLVRLF